MAHTPQTRSERWTLQQTLLLTAACLMAGIAGGWMLRVWRSPAPAASVQAASLAPTPARLQSMADADAAPLLVKLRSDPRNPDLLTSIGNLYYDAGQYPVAIDYYARALRLKPSDTAVRTDRGTALWYLGNADAAIAELNEALRYEPTNPNTLFNLGIVMWQGRSDLPGAIADWKKLLEANPNYAGKEKVEQMIADLEKQGSAPAAKSP